jgi:hypothetical protein
MIASHTTERGRKAASGVVRSPFDLREFSGLLGRQSHGRAAPHVKTARPHIPSLPCRGLRPDDPLSASHVIGPAPSPLGARVAYLLWVMAGRTG